jgi:hypothetical protein
LEDFMNTSLQAREATLATGSSEGDLSEVMRGYVVNAIIRDGREKVPLLSNLRDTRFMVNMDSEVALEFVGPDQSPEAYAEVVFFIEGLVEGLGGDKHKIEARAKIRRYHELVKDHFLRRTPVLEVVQNLRTV